MKRTLLYVVISVLVLTLGACSAKEADSSPSEAKKTPVKVTEVQKGNLEAEKEVIAKVKANANVVIFPKAAGELISLKVKKGDQVKKGQVLAEVDKGDLRHAYSLEQANYENAKVQLETAKINLIKAEKNLETAKASVGKDQGASTEVPGSLSYVQWQNAKKNLERMKALYEVGAVSLKEYEDAQLGEQQARIAYEQASINVDVAKESVEQSKLAVKQAEVGLKQAQVRLQQSSESLADASVKATIDGEVVGIAAEVGDLVSGQSPLFTIVSLNPVIVEAQISPDQLSLFKEGEDIFVNIPALQQNVKGKITFVSPVTNETGLYMVEAEVGNKEQLVKPGMAAKLLKSNVLVGDAFLVPTEAILTKSGKDIMYIVKGEKVVEVEVQVLNSQTDMTAITGDIKEGDQVVIKGQNTLGDGMAVEVIKEER